MLALAPDGSPRGAPVRVTTYASVGRIRPAISADGARALLLFSGLPPGGTAGMHEVPLECVP